MKKKLSVFISALMAVVLCFALIACGDGSNNNGENDQPPDFATAVAKLRDAEGLKGKASSKLTSEGGESPLEFEADYETRGAAVKFKRDDDSGKFDILNLATGYYYYDTGSGYVPTQVYPQYTLEYTASVIKKAVENASSSSGYSFFTNKLPTPPEFEYNASVRAWELEYDLTQYVNNFLIPLEENYETGNLLNLSDAYLKQFGNNFNTSAVLNLVQAAILGYQDKTIGEIIEKPLQDKNITVAEFAAMLIGRELSQDELSQVQAALKTRTVGDAIVALTTYFVAHSEDLSEIEIDFQALMSVISSGDTSALMDMLTSVLIEQLDSEAVINAILFGTIDAGDTAEKSLIMLKNMLIGLLETQKVKPLVDKYLFSVSGMSTTVESFVKNELKAIITNKVKLVSLKTDVTLFADSNGDINAISVFAYAEHDCTESVADSYLLADNKYTADVKINIDEYLTTAEKFDITFSENMNMPSASAIIYEAPTSDVSVYCEFGKFEATLTDMSALGLDKDGNLLFELEANGNVTFDAQTRTFVFASEFIDTVTKRDDFGGVIAVTANIPGGTVKASLVFSDSPKDLITIFRGIFEAMM